MGDWSGLVPSKHMFNEDAPLKTSSDQEHQPRVKKPRAGALLHCTHAEMGLKAPARLTPLHVRPASSTDLSVSQSVLSLLCL